MKNPYIKYKVTSLWKLTFAIQFEWNRWLGYSFDITIPKNNTFFFVLIFDRIVILTWIMRLQNRFSIIAWRRLESFNNIGRVFDEWKMMFWDVDALSIFNTLKHQYCKFVARFFVSKLRHYMLTNIYCSKIEILLPL